MHDAHAYRDFTVRFNLLATKNPDLVATTLGNIFTMRLIGNKTHGDLAEIAVAEFINQYMYDFRSVHVGKNLFRAKSREEDIRIINEITKAEFPVSLKAYGDGPLQLSTDKEYSMFPRLEREGGDVIGHGSIERILEDPAFADFGSINVMPLIYNEKSKKCNILIFNYVRARAAMTRIVREDVGRGRKYPVYRFYSMDDEYICEVRYGGVAANALQRGLWTHTRKGLRFFDSITNGWIEYSHNLVLTKLFSHALVASEAGHAAALKEIMTDIAHLKRATGTSKQ